MSPLSNLCHLNNLHNRLVRLQADGCVAQPPAKCHQLARPSLIVTLKCDTTRLLACSSSGTDTPESATTLRSSGRGSRPSRRAVEARGDWGCKAVCSRPSGISKTKAESDSSVQPQLKAKTKTTKTGVKKSSGSNKTTPKEKPLTEEQMDHIEEIFLDMVGVLKVEKEGRRRYEQPLPSEDDERGIAMLLAAAESEGDLKRGTMIDRGEVGVGEMFRRG